MSEPGRYPYEAGIRASGYRERPWRMRQYAGLGDAAATNQRFRYLLDLGETGLSLAFDLPTQLGLDPDHPEAAAEVGRAGVSVATVDDLRTVFDGLPLDEVSVAFTINATAPMILAMWVVAAEETGVDPTALRGTLQNEMLKEFLARKAYIYDVDTSFRYSLDVVEYAVRHLPRVYPVSISGGHVREAGANLELEIACAVADAEQYLEGATARGLGVDEVLPRFSFILGTHMEFLREAVKFRAARRLYARRMTERYGARDPRSAQMRISVNTFGSALARQEPLNNIARSTVQALAAVLGGVQSLHVSAFDEAHRTPSGLAARVALRVQQILAEETDLRAYPDPLGGSRAVEALTDAIEADAVAWLSRIEQRGGMLACLRSGWLEREVEAQAYRQRGPVVGVTTSSPDPAEEALVLPEAERLWPAGRPPRARATSAAAASSLEWLARVAGRGENVLPALIEAARHRATIGQMTAAMAPPSSGRTPPASVPGTAISEEA